MDHSDENTKPAPPAGRIVLVNGRGSLLHRLRIAQEKSAQAGRQPTKALGMPRPRKPSMPKLPWNES